MASNNAIGTGALILTTNADQMLAGMDAAGAAASRKAAGISKSVDKAGSGGKGGGLLGSFLAGAAGGVVGAIGSELLLKGLTGHLESLNHIFETLSAKATGFNAGALAGIEETLHGIQDAGVGILQKFVTAAAPAIMVLGESLIELFQKLEPIIQGCADVFEAFAFTGAELISELIDSIGELGIDTSDWGKIALDVLRAVAKGFAYLWDVVKAGAGAIAVVAGLIVEGIGIILQLIAKAITKLNDLAQKLPENLRPGWLQGVADTVQGWGDTVDSFGARIRNWGTDAIMGFGNSAKRVDEFFDRVGQRLAETKDKIAGLGAEELKLSGAALKGGTEAYKIIARDATQGMVDSMAVAKKQLLEQQRGNQKLDKIERNTSHSGHGLGRI